MISDLGITRKTPTQLQSQGYGPFIAGQLHSLNKYMTRDMFSSFNVQSYGYICTSTWKKSFFFSPRRCQNQTEARSLGFGPWVWPDSTVMMLSHSCCFEGKGWFSHGSKRTGVQRSVLSPASVKRFQNAVWSVTFSLFSGKHVGTHRAKKARQS